MIGQYFIKRFKQGFKIVCLALACFILAGCNPLESGGSNGGGGGNGGGGNPPTVVVCTGANHEHVDGNETCDAYLAEEEAKKNLADAKANAVKFGISPDVDKDGLGDDISTISDYITKLQNPANRWGTSDEVDSLLGGKVSMRYYPNETSVTPYIAVVGNKGKVYLYTKVTAGSSTRDLYAEVVFVDTDTGYTKIVSIADGGYAGEKWTKIDINPDVKLGANYEMFIHVLKASTISPPDGKRILKAVRK